MQKKNVSTTGQNMAYGLLAAAVLIGCPFILPIYWTLILTEIVIMGFFAMSFNLLLGYTGLLSFGQAGFFGVGAYGVGLILMSGGESLFIAMAVGVLSAAFAALLIGYLCVRRDEIYFAMITLGFGMMLYTIAHSWIELTGGSDGLPILSLPPLRLLGMELSLFDPVNIYFLVVVVCALGAWVLWRVVRSPFGLMLRAMRENKERLSFAGADVQRVRLVAFVVAGALAGLAGGLFALFSTMATPDFLHWGFSAKAVLMTVLGGSEIFFGPAFGAAIFFGLEQLATHYTENWMIILGAIIIPVVIFFPKGILGTLVHWFRTKKEKRS
jgi:branched-chain amino acid transport system permease protein